ncbi:MAG: ABC transporter permease [Candidatus Thorarchaeota archaeon]
MSKVFLKGIVPLFILIGLWSVIAWVSGGITIIDIAEDFIHLSVVGDSEGHTLLEHTGLSMFRVTLGFLAAVITAIPLGIAIGRYKSLDSVMGPVIEAMRPIPPIAWIPLAILMFSPVLLYSQIFIIWVGAFFPLLINTTTGVKRTNPVHIDVAETFGTSEVGIITKIVIPSAAPEIFAGLKLGFGIGWMCLVAAEMIGSGRGLGYLVIIMQQAGRTGSVISSMLVIGLIGFIISFIFHLAEKNLLKWRQDVSI